MVERFDFSELAYRAHCEHFGAAYSAMKRSKNKANASRWRMYRWLGLSPEGYATFRHEHNEYHMNQLAKHVPKISTG